MDYEFRIQLLEKETAHLREMQQLSIQRQDTTDMRLDKLGEITHLLVESTATLGSHIDAVGSHVGAVGSHVEALGSKIDSLVTKMDTFLDALLRQSHNGH